MISSLILSDVFSKLVLLCSIGFAKYLIPILSWMIKPRFQILRTNNLGRPFQSFLFLSEQGVSKNIGSKHQPCFQVTFFCNHNFPFRVAGQVEESTVIQFAATENNINSPKKGERASHVVRPAGSIWRKASWRIQRRKGKKTPAVLGQRYSIKNI